MPARTASLEHLPASPVFAIACGDLAIGSTKASLRCTLQESDNSKFHRIRGYDRSTQETVHLRQRHLRIVFSQAQEE